METAVEKRKVEKIRYFARSWPIITIRPAPLTVSEGGLTKRAPQGIMSDHIEFRKTTESDLPFAMPAVSMYVLDPALVSEERYWLIRRAIEGGTDETGQYRPACEDWRDGRIWTERQARERTVAEEEKGDRIGRESLILKLAQLRGEDEKVVGAEVKKRLLVTAEIRREIATAEEKRNEPAKPPVLPPVAKPPGPKPR